MIRNSEYFTFNGQDSRLYNIINVNLEGGLLEEPTYSRTIVETAIPGRIKPYHHRTDENPLSFSVVFKFENGFDNDEHLRQVSRWLRADGYYKPLKFSNDDRTFFVIFDTSTLTTNCANDGYYTLNVKCNAPWGFSDEIELDWTSPSTITIVNNGDEIILPQIWIKNLGVTGTVKLVNTGTDKEFGFTEIAQNETIFVDCENGDVLSDIPETYRLDDLIDLYFLELDLGVNEFSVVGDVEVKMKYREILLA